MCLIEQVLYRCGCPKSSRTIKCAARQRGYCDDEIVKVTRVRVDCAKHHINLAKELFMCDEKGVWPRKIHGLVWMDGSLVLIVSRE
jgi:hypothetical protein